MDVFSAISSRYSHKECFLPDAVPLEELNRIAQAGLLAATGLGYASLWLDSPYFCSERRKKASNVLGAPDHFHLWAVLPIGKPDGKGSRREKLPFADRVSYGRFGNPSI